MEERYHPGLPLGVGKGGTELPGGDSEVQAALLGDLVTADTLSRGGHEVSICLHEGAEDAAGETFPGTRET